MKSDIIYLEIQELKTRIMSKDKRSPIDAVTLMRIEEMESLPKNIISVDFRHKIVYYRK